MKNKIMESKFFKKISNISIKNKEREECRLYPNYFFLGKSKIIYKDPHVYCKNYYDILEKKLNKILIPDLVKLILAYICGGDKIKDKLIYSGKSGEFLGGGYDYICAKCKRMTVFDLERIYDTLNQINTVEYFNHYGFVHTECSKQIFNVYNNYRATGYFYEQYDSENDYHDFHFTKGWYGKVIHMTDGDSLRKSLYKMRELILDKYPKYIIDKITWGYINKPKLFDTVVARLKNNILSLGFFCFLLSTPSVYFINTNKELLFDNMIWDYIPSYYTCFFLIEATKDIDKVTINPIRFGCGADGRVSYVIKRKIWAEEFK